MKVLILAAGLGTRLRPLTNDRPKALVKLEGKTLLDHAIDKVKAAGFDEIAVNVHHFADMVEEFIQENYPELNIVISDERTEIQGSGGALKHAERFLEGDTPFLVYNVDVLSDIDLSDMLREFKERNASVLMAVRKRDTIRKLCYERGRLCGWKNLQTGELKGKNGDEYAFSGIQIVDPQLLKNMPKGKFSIIDHYLRIAKDENILAYDHSFGIWMDLGTPERLKEAEGRNW